MAFSDSAFDLLDMDISPIRPGIISDKIDMTDSLAAIDGIAEVFQPLGCSICALIWIVHFVQNTLQDNDVNEKKMFFDLIFACFCALIISNFTAIIDLANNIGQTTTDLLKLGSNDVEVTLKDLIGDVEDKGLIQVCATCLLYYSIGTIAGWICTGIAYLALYTRQIEICVRTIFMPIALGFLTDDGWRGPAIRYVKKYIACYLQGPIILACVYVYCILTGPGTEFDFVGFFALAFACAGLIQKSSSIANDIMGV